MLFKKKKKVQFGHGIMSFCNSADMQVKYLAVLVQEILFLYVSMHAALIRKLYRLHQYSLLLVLKKKKKKNVLASGIFLPF